MAIENGNMLNSSNDERSVVVGPRMTIVESLYHSNKGSSPTSVEHRYDRLLNSDEQVYKRQLYATESWTCLDTGWIEPEQCAMVHIANEGSKPLYLLFESCLINDDWQRYQMIILPKETLRMQVVDVSVLRIRCEEGRIKYLLTLLPA